MTGRRWLRGVAPLVALVACGDIWGFHDLTAPPDATFTVADATPMVDTSQPPQEAASTLEAMPADDATSDDAGDDADAAAVEDAADASLDAIVDATHDASDAGEPVEASPPEAGAPNDGAADAIAACQAICSGCCDSAGRCELGTSTDVCGVSGALCQSCGNHSCILTYSPCCRSNGACGCEDPTTILGCN
jgi:hypothetical protein